MRRYLILIIALILTGCARHYGTELELDLSYGFFAGLWHGLIMPFSILINIISWILSVIGISFLADIQIIGRPNTGFFFYYIGLIIGISPYFNK